MQTDDLNNLLRKNPIPKNLFFGAKARNLPGIDNVLSFYQATIPHSTPSHHHRFVLVINLGGSGTVIVNDTFCKVGKNQCVLILPFQFHHYANFKKGDVSLLFITFESEHNELLEPMARSVLPLSDRAQRYIKEFVSIYVNRSSGRGNNQVVLMGNVLLEELLGSRRIRMPSAALDTDTPGIVKKVATLLFANLDKPMQISDIADSLGMSAGYLRNVFKKSCGISLGKYMMSARMNRACQLLESTDNSISHISSACGFTSVYSFSRAFKNELSITPPPTEKDIRIVLAEITGSLNKNHSGLAAKKD